MKNFWLLAVLICSAQANADTCNFHSTAHKDIPGVEFLSANVSSKDECSKKCRFKANEMRDEEKVGIDHEAAYTCQWGMEEKLFEINDICADYKLSQDRALIALGINGKPPKVLFEVKNEKLIRPITRTGYSDVPKSFQNCFQKAQFNREFEAFAGGKSLGKVKVELGVPVILPMGSQTALITNGKNKNYKWSLQGDYNSGTIKVHDIKGKLLGETAWGDAAGP